MSRQQPERNIPHLRDIFGFHGNWNSQTPRNNEDITQQTLTKFQDMKLSNDGSKDRLPGSSSAGNDSAISVGSTSEDETPRVQAPTNNKKKKQRSRRDNSRTLTEKDVKHLERHLSMKKTIRKKIMRDLQQAFVEDPNEFRVEDISPEQLKAEINIQSLSFGTPSQKTGKKASAESNFLDMLRGGSTNSTPSGRFINDDEDSGHGSPTRESSSNRIGDYDDDEDIYETESGTNKKTSFWRRFTMKGRNKR
ncbi:uncharacterized protein LOC110828422 [Zootermopsis nevadensis]|uniref:uncharacterized protein LOC110828422 n=1 Tax=Zootermopsis nevadensis TaxID=136037 RepID=UPI000B8ED94F|nr:uncharacterized protein LOC110828422 [Zootermopsis nevadensis]XP_021916844.1 uncharacterized protein LOC110828422 [Zootermopsis nevadensis]